MLRILLGLVVGAVVALAAVYLWQLAGHSIFAFGVQYPLDPLKRPILVQLTFPAQAWVVAGYVFGVVVGGALGNWIADARWPAVFIAVMVVGLYFATLTAARHPFWMQAAGILLPFLTGLVLAKTVGRRRLRDV